MKEYNRGERVVCTTAGMYGGIPGTIRGKAQWQHNLDTRYNIDLDCGVSITRPANLIASCTERDEANYIQLLRDQAAGTRSDTYSWQEWSRINRRDIE